MKGVANLGAGAVRLGERAAENFRPVGHCRAHWTCCRIQWRGHTETTESGSGSRTKHSGKSHKATRGAQTIGRTRRACADFQHETTYDPRKTDSIHLPQSGWLFGAAGRRIAGDWCARLRRSWQARQ